jgi:NAD(P)-dependent dehydrogenase (short-subunit alcohol dehydrogenase family)
MGIFEENSTPKRAAAVNFGIADKVCIVTGGAGHLGSAMASALAEAGAHVWIVSRNQTNCARLAGQLADSGLRAEAFAVDVTKPHEIKNLISVIGDRHGRLDIIVNNAHGGGPGTMEQSDMSKYVQAMELAVGAAATFVNEARSLLAAAAMREGDAAVINVSSMYGMVSPDPRIYGTSGLNNPPHYGAAKAGLLQYTRYAACHLAPLGIRVNAISPGPFPRDVICQQDPAFCEILAERVPLGRIGRPQDLAGAVVFLASPAARYITGVNLPVDGGWTAW